MTARVGFKTEVDLGVVASSEEPKSDLEELGRNKSGVAVSNILTGLLPFTMALLGAESSFSSLSTTKP